MASALTHPLEQTGWTQHPVAFAHPAPRRSGMTYLPLKLFVGYILVTLLISFFGPMEYDNFDRTSVAVYIGAFLLIFSLSYGLGIRRTRNLLPSHGENPTRRTMTVVKWCVVIAFVAKVVDLAIGVATNGLHLSLGDMGNNYVEMYADYVRNSGRSQSLMFFVNLPLTLPAQAAMILGVYHYKFLERRYRFMLVAMFLAVLIANTVGQGKQKQFGDIVIFLIAVGLLKYAMSGSRPRKGVSFLVLALVALAAVTFAFILEMRYAAIGISAANYNAKSSAQTWMNFNHPMFRILGPELGFPIAMLLTGYLSGGYYGLSLCLKLPFEWTYFLGSSYSMMVAFARFFGTSFLLEDTYPLRMEEATGYSAMTKWQTIFPWLASDFTFIGTLFVLGAMGWVYAVAWREATIARNPVSILLFGVMTLGLVFVPANNQLMIAPDGVIAVWALALLWIFRRRGYGASKQNRRPFVLTSATPQALK